MFLFLLSSIISLNASASMSQFQPCLDQHAWAANKCTASNLAPSSTGAQECITLATNCANTCKSKIDYSNSESRRTRGKTLILQPSELTAATTKLNACIKFVTDRGGEDPTNSSDNSDSTDETPADASARDSNPTQQCQEFKGKIDTQAKLDELIKTPEVLATCVSVCKTATEGKPATDAAVKDMIATGDKCYRAIPNDPGLGTASDETPAADDAVSTDTSADNTTPTTTPNYNNSPYSPLQNFSTPEVGTDLSKIASNVVNWATGPQADAGLYDSVAAATSQAANASSGFNPTPGINTGNLATASVSHNTKPNEGGNGGSNGGGGGGSPSSPGSMGGGGSPSGPSPGRSAANNGGPRFSPAGSQLSKVGQNTFYSGGGSLASMGGGAKMASREAPNKRKPAFTSPKYAPKTDDGGSALARMFGKSPKANVVHNNVASGFATYGQSCLNTVFCGIENRFQDLLKDYDTEDVPSMAADKSEVKEVRKTASDPQKD